MSPCGFSNLGPLNFLLLLPFSYAFFSRYRFDLRFHFLVDFIPSFLVCVFFGEGFFLNDLTKAALCYGAFISVYEIGYIVNDYISVKWETDARQRGPAPAEGGMLTAWVLSRLTCFWGSTKCLGDLADYFFFGFYLFLVLVFAAHNLLTRKELKFCTFFWLSVCRFVAPTFFILSDANRLSMLVAATVLYSSIRGLSYLESKGLLAMPGRKSPSFRLILYVMPIPLAVALGWSPFMLLSLYFLGVAFGDFLRNLFRPA